MIHPNSGSGIQHAVWNEGEAEKILLFCSKSLFSTSSLFPLKCAEVKPIYDTDELYPKLYFSVKANTISTVIDYYFSAEAYRESYVPDTKGEKLAERRRALAQLLQHENMMYQVVYYFDFNFASVFQRSITFCLL